MLLTISICETLVFVFFFILEKVYPARHLKRAEYFYLWLVFVNGFSMTLFSIVYFLWVEMPEGLIVNDLGRISNGFIFYLIWSFFGYWWHRLRHSNSFLWNVIHKFHHSAPKMETAVAYFKHPLEYASNLVLVTTMAWIFSMPPESVVMGLAMEGMLETYHHSNIKTPKWLKFMGYIIQTPEMHLVHHQRKLHKYNYATIIWDTVFGTVRIPDIWEGEQGLKAGYNIKKMFFLRS